MDYQIGKDLTVKWNLLYADGNEFPIGDYSLRFRFITGRGQTFIDSADYSVEDGLLTWTFAADKQYMSGAFTLDLQLFTGETFVTAFICHNAFSLGLSGSTDGSVTVTTYAEKIFSSVTEAEKAAVRAEYAYESTKTLHGLLLEDELDEESMNILTNHRITVELGKKQDTLTTDQQNAVDSGITSEKVEKYDGYESILKTLQGNAYSASLTAKYTGYRYESKYGDSVNATLSLSARLTYAGSSISISPVYYNSDDAVVTSGNYTMNSASETFKAVFTYNGKTYSPTATAYAYGRVFYGTMIKDWDGSWVFGDVNSFPVGTSNLLGLSFDFEAGVDSTKFFVAVPEGVTGYENSSLPFMVGDFPCAVEMQKNYTNDDFVSDVTYCLFTSKPSYSEKELTVKIKE